MKKIKLIVDRERLDSDYIKSRQDFGQILNEVNQFKPPNLKLSWFYGPIGLSVFTAVVSITALEPPLNTQINNVKENLNHKLLLAPDNSEQTNHLNKTTLFDKNITLNKES